MVHYLCYIAVSCDIFLSKRFPYVTLLSRHQLLMAGYSSWTQVKEKLDKVTLHKN